ncbi:MAG: helix-turn-helix domain-containing protein [Proteobacteria bacterium]|nr:helix-turn-helix domain-containing protein [Pseudomonadota bacterium]
MKIEIPSLQTACAQCNLREFCLPGDLGNIDMDRFNTVLGGRIRIKRGHHLYRSGERFSAIYAVKSGFFKTDVLTDDARDHVTGFQMAGEILGMDGISNEVHTCNAVALEDSEVCLIPYADLEGLSRELRTLQHQLHKVMSREIVRGHSTMLLLGVKRVDESLAAFLLDLSKRLTARGYSPTEFHLRMTREEIGSYLGLKLETVSRSFSRFQEEGIISVEQRHIRILDISGLKKLMTRIPANPRCIVPTNSQKMRRLQGTSRGLHEAAVLSA